MDSVDNKHLDVMFENKIKLKVVYLFDELWRKKEKSTEKKQVIYIVRDILSKFLTYIGSFFFFLKGKEDIFPLSKTVRE